MVYSWLASSASNAPLKFAVICPTIVCLWPHSWSSAITVFILHVMNNLSPTTYEGGVTQYHEMLRKQTQHASIWELPNPVFQIRFYGFVFSRSIAVYTQNLCNDTMFLKHYFSQIRKWLSIILQLWTKVQGQVFTFMPIAWTIHNLGPI